MALTVAEKLFILLSYLTIIKANTGCSGNYQYERQPLTSFTHCNPVRSILLLSCSVLVPHDSTTVTVDWYWSKNISECGRNVMGEEGRFAMTANRGYSHLTNVDRITTDLQITSPQTDTGYYWCQVNDPSYNGEFISSYKTPVFDTGTMTVCNERQSTLQTKCAVGSVPSLVCAMETSSPLVSSSSLTLVPSPSVLPLPLPVKKCLPSFGTYYNVSMTAAKFACPKCNCDFLKEKVVFDMLLDKLLIPGQTIDSGCTVKRLQEFFCKDNCGNEQNTIIKASILVLCDSCVKNIQNAEKKIRKINQTSIYMKIIPINLTNAVTSAKAHPTTWPYKPNTLHCDCMPTKEMIRICDCPPECS